ncbi:MAG: hypothetical protein C0514_04330 [Candidatus Puniceispirillum sp.]|nr:hypothetical protein [Candidatus Puniceispirillum sp.]
MKTAWVLAMVFCAVAQSWTHLGEIDERTPLGSTHAIPTAPLTTQGGHASAAGEEDDCVTGCLLYSGFLRLLDCFGCIRVEAQDVPVPSVSK